MQTARLSAQRNKLIKCFGVIKKVVFLAHDIYPDVINSIAPIQITHQTNIAIQADVLLNLTAHIPTAYTQFSRVIEIINQHEAIKQAGTRTLSPISAKWAYTRKYAPYSRISTPMTLQIKSLYFLHKISSRWAAIQGLNTPELANCRVCVLGCDNPMDILNSAMQYPDARFDVYLDSDSAALTAVREVLARQATLQMYLHDWDGVEFTHYRARR